MTTRAEKLNKLVDAIPGICSDGRDGIRALVSEITGEDLAEKLKGEHRIGDHFKLGTKTLLLALTGYPTKKVVAINIETGARRVRTDGTTVRDFYHITDEELAKILRVSSWTLINSVKKVHTGVNT